MTYTRVLLTHWGGPEALQVVTEDSLPEPGPGEVRVRVLARTVSFSDRTIRQGRYPMLGKKPPFTPGYDLVGRIDKLGPGVIGVTIGQMVADLTITGSYTDYAILPAAGLVPVPDDLDPAEVASLVLAYVTAYQMLHHVAGVQPEQRMLVHGASGAVGSALLQLGRLQDMVMYGTASAANHELVRELGATPIDYQNEDFVVRVYDLTRGAGADVIFDGIGLSNLKRSWQILSDDGVLVSYGFTNAGRGGREFVPAILAWLALKNLLPNGRRAHFYAISKKNAERFRDDLIHLCTLLAERKIAPVIAERFPLEQVQRAHTCLDTGGVPGRIVLVAEEWYDSK